MFNSIYAKQLFQYYNLRCSILSESAKKHELCYLRRFDNYIKNRITTQGNLTEDFINSWIGTLSGKSSSVENEVIVIRQFLNYIQLSGENVFIPVIPKVHEDYIPYIFNDHEIAVIFQSADNVIQKNPKTDPYLVIEFPVILRLLYSCGLRIGETVKLTTNDVDIDKGTLRLINTKGDKQRLVPMSSIMTDILTNYCMVMGLLGKSNQWLFPSAKSNSHISDKAIKRRFEVILKENDIVLENRKKYERGPCLHCLRHVFAFQSFAKIEHEGKLLNDAVPYLSLYLGHDSLSETEKYLTFSNEMFPESIDAFGSFMCGLLPEVDYET